MREIKALLDPEHFVCVMDGLSTMKRGYVEKEDVPSVLENSQSISPEMRGEVSASTIRMFWE